MSKTPTLIVMCGNSSVGKSTLAHEIQDTHNNCVIVSKDDIRLALLEPNDSYFAHEKEVEKKYYDNISRSLRNFDYVVADAIYLTPKSRKKLFTNIELPRGTRKVAVWIDAPLENCLKQNAARIGRARVSDEVIKEQYNKAVSPKSQEGFDDIIFISIRSNLTIDKSYSFLQEIKEKLKNI